MIVVCFLLLFQACKISLIASNTLHFYFIPFKSSSITFLTRHFLQECSKHLIISGMLTVVYNLCSMGEILNWYILSQKFIVNCATLCDYAQETLHPNLWCTLWTVTESFKPFYFICKYGKCLFLFLKQWRVLYLHLTSQGNIYVLEAFVPINIVKISSFSYPLEQDSLLNTWF